MSGPWEDYQSPSSTPWEDYATSEKSDKQRTPKRAAAVVLSPKEKADALVGNGVQAGIAEPLMAMGSGMAGSAAGGLAGLAALVGNKLGMTGTDPADVVRKVQSSMTYQPRTQIGQAVTQGMAAPFEMANRGLGMLGGLAGGDSLANVVKGGDTAGQAIGENLLPALGAIAGGRPAMNAARNVEAVGATQAASRIAQSQVEAAAKQTSEAARAPLTETANIVRKYGFAVPPQELSGGQSGIAANTLRHMVSNPSLAAGGSLRNVSKVGDIFREEAGLLPGTPLSKAGIDSKIKEKGQAYENVKSLDGEFNTGFGDEGSPYRKAVEKISGDYTETAKKFPESMGYPKTSELQEELGVEKITPKDAIELIKRLRERSNKAMDSAEKGNLEAAEMGSVFRRAANSIESVVAKNLKDSGDSRTYTQFVNSRKDIAKLYNMRAAIDDGSGTPNPQVIGKLYEMGEPLSGKLLDVGRVASEHKQYFQPLKAVSGKVVQSHMTPTGTSVGAAGEFLGANRLIQNTLLNSKLPWKNVGGAVVQPPLPPGMIPYEPSAPDGYVPIYDDLGRRGLR